MTYFGPMWFDNNPKATIEQKIRTAIAHYTTAGMVFNTCRVHPSMVNGLLLVDGIRIEPDREVMPNHFWFGRMLEDGHG